MKSATAPKAVTSVQDVYSSGEDEMELDKPVKQAAVPVKQVCYILFVLLYKYDIILI